jgi:RNA polymerase sigma factor (sigma-70 family)
VVEQARLFLGDDDHPASAIGEPFEHGRPIVAPGLRRAGISRTAAPERSPYVTLPPFQTLLDDHRHVVYRYLVAAVGPHDANDCFQETMLAALRAYPSLRDGSNLGGWLFTIAHRKVIDMARARDRRPVPVGAVPERSLDEEPAILDPTDDVWVAVRGLPPKQRSAVLLRIVADRPYGEIADALECSDAAARQNVHAGLERLREVVRP